MDSLVQADIFFFITTVSVVLLTAFLVALAIYIIGILKDVRRVTRRLHQVVDKFGDDFETFLKVLKVQGIAIEKLLQMFIGRAQKSRSGKSKKSSNGQ